MNGELYFCNDGILRLKPFKDNEPAIPLITIQETLNETPYLILKYLRHCVHVEQNTSLKNFILCLEPWADILGDIVDRKIKLYIEEVKIDREFTPNEIEWIGIYQLISFQQKTEFIDKIDFENTDTPDILTKLKTKPGNYYKTEHFYTASGMIKGEDNHYSISGDIQDIKHLPVIIHKYGNFSIYQSTLEKNKIQAIGMGIHKVRSTTYITATAETPTLLDAIEAVFVEGLFYDSPSSADNAMDILKEAQESLNDYLASKKDSDSTKANSSKLKIVGETEDADIKNNQETESEEPVMKVVFADGCLDDLYEDLHRSDSEWEYIKSESFKHNSSTPFRVGTIRTGKAPEEKIGDKIMHE